MPKNVQMDRDHAREIRKALKDEMAGLLEQYITQAEAGPAGLGFWNQFDATEEVVMSFLKWVHEKED